MLSGPGGGLLEGRGKSDHLNKIFRIISQKNIYKDPKIIKS